MHDTEEHIEPPKKERKLRLRSRGTVRIKGGGRKIVRIVDLSVHAIGISYTDPFKVGSFVEIEMGLRVEGNITPLILRGKVYHSHLKGSFFYTRIKFDELDSEYKSAIKKAINK